MTEELWADVDRYLADQLIGADESLEWVLEASAAAGLPAINVSATQGKLLSLLARAAGARNVLELGTLGGYSAIWLARALPDGGRVVTVESDARHAALARQNFTRAGCGTLVDLRVGRALDVLPELEAERRHPFDFIFIDADKPSYPRYLDWAIRLARPGTVIVADNVVRKGSVVDEQSQDAAVLGIRRFLAAIANDRRITATAVQTVGTKGYDGFAVILVN